MKFQIEHQTSYWHDFKIRYNAKDFEHFIDKIVMPNSRLANIALFTFYPDIERNIKNYPVGKKINELDTHISNDDRQELYELMNKEDGLIGDHLSYLNKMFGVVETIIRTKTKFPKIPLENIFAFNSYHQITKLKSNTGITKEIESIGNQHPIFWTTFETSSHGKNFERIVHLNFIESMPDLKKQWNEWENYTTSCYEKFSAYPKKDKMLFGTDPNLSHKVVFYFRGQKLDLPYSKHKGDLIFPIGDRYQPLLDRELRRARKLKLLDKDSSLDLRLQNILRESISTYDPEKGPFPSHANTKLQGFVTSQYRKKDHTTTKGEKLCTDDMIDVWYSCRYKRPKNKSISDCERRRNGFCKWPEAKRQLQTELSGNDQELKNDSKSVIDEIGLKDLKRKLKQDLCRDNADWEILQAVLNGAGVFKSGKINYSKTARIVGTYDKDVTKRWIKIQKRSNKNHEIYDILK